MSFATSGSFPASLIPAQKKQALSNNYLNFADGTSTKLKLRDMVIEHYQVS